MFASFRSYPGCHAEVARHKSTIKGATEHAIFLRALFFARVEKPLAPRVPRSLETSEIDSKGQSTTVAWFAPYTCSGYMGAPYMAKYACMCGSENPIFWLKRNFLHKSVWIQWASFRWMPQYPFPADNLKEYKIKQIPNRYTSWKSN
jgi:hypothetical protein